MNKKIISLMLISILFGCTSTQKGADKPSLPTVFYQALGATPNWSVEVQSSSITFYSEDFDGQQQFDVMASGDGEILSYNSANTAQDFSLVLEEHVCLDKVSGQSMQYNATFTFGDITYLGCAQRIDN